MIISSIVAFVAGILLGYLFFGGLWLTLQKLATANNPAALAVLSMVGRLALVAAGFYLVARGSQLRLIVALVGFICARWMLVSHLGHDLERDLGDDIEDDLDDDLDGDVSEREGRDSGA